ncbi:MAG: radical SAM protein [Caldisphaera sp.]|jgi:uncharacterized Fe-S cluster-containing radical SAM superfamily enzyme
MKLVCNISLNKYSRFFGKDLYYIDKPIPLMGHIAFGIIDRGTNVIQIRPSTLCFHDCIFCSVDAGPNSKNRRNEYIVDEYWLKDWVEEISRIKGKGIEALIDGVGEPITHPKILKIISLLRQIKEIDNIVMETHGGSLSFILAKQLEKAGLNRINLSIDTLNPEKAKILTNSYWYDVSKVLEVAEKIIKETNLDIILTPVIVPGYNEEDMKQIINWAKNNKLGKKSNLPTGVLIQKFEVHHFGRKPNKVKSWSWDKFYSYLKKLEAETNYRLIVRPDELGFRKTTKIEVPYNINEKVKINIIGAGWLRSEYLGVDKNCLRVITVISPRLELKDNTEIYGKIIRNKDNIFVAKLL